MDFEIREATIEDLDQILNLNQMLFDYEFKNFDGTINCSWPPSNEGYFKKSIASGDSLALVVLIGGRVIGYLVGSISKGENYRIIERIGEIDNVFVEPEFRGHGIGTSLYERFFEWAKEKGLKRVRVEASAENRNAILSYRKNGFFDYNLILERDL